jgi:hypothetical protein
LKPDYGTRLRELDRTLREVRAELIRKRRAEEGILEILKRIPHWSRDILAVTRQIDEMVEISAPLDLEVREGTVWLPSGARVTEIKFVHKRTAYSLLVCYELNGESGVNRLERKDVVLTSLHGEVLRFLRQVVIPRLRRDARKLEGFRRRLLFEFSREILLQDL